MWDTRGAGTSGTSCTGLTGHPLRLFGHSGLVYDVDWTPCRRFVFSAIEDGSVRLWNPAMRTDLVSYRGHNYPVCGVSFAPYGHHFATGSHNRTARLRATDRMLPVRILAGHLADVHAVRWHPNCIYVATGSRDRTARLCDVRDGKSVRVMPDCGTVHALAFAPDDGTLACGGDANVVDIWGVASGKWLHRLASHKSTDWILEYSRHGAVLASGGADWRICLCRTEDWYSMPPELAGSRKVGAEEMRVRCKGEGVEGGKDADGNVMMGEADNAKKDGDDGTKKGDKGKEDDKERAWTKARRTTATTHAVTATVVFSAIFATPIISVAPFFSTHTCAALRAKAWRRLCARTEAR